MKHLKKYMLLGYLLLLSSELFAQTNNAIGAINEATNMLRNSFDPLVKLAYAFCAIIALVGGVKGYKKLQSGDPDASKTIMAWAFGFIFAVLIVTIIKSFFF